MRRHQISFTRGHDAARLCPRYARPIDSFDASGVGFSIRLGARVEDRVVRNVDALGQVGGHEQESVLDPLGVQCLGNCNFAKLDGWPAVRPNLSRIVCGIVRGGQLYQQAEFYRSCLERRPEIVGERGGGRLAASSSLT
jgi:hypothetical protein